MCFQSHTILFFDKTEYHKKNVELEKILLFQKKDKTLCEVSELLYSNIVTRNIIFKTHNNNTYDMIRINREYIICDG